LNEDVCRSRRG